jgi:hypothetical protein
MIKTLQESLSLKLHDKNTTDSDMMKLSLLVDSMTSIYAFENDWLEEFNNNIEFELGKA